MHTLLTSQYKREDKEETASTKNNVIKCEEWIGAVFPLQARRSEIHVCNQRDINCLTKTNVLEEFHLFPL